MANIRPLPPALTEAAKEELHEDPARVEDDLKHIRDWLSKQPHLRARTDDQFLVTFLRGSKFSLERTKEKLDAYYTLRTALPAFFANRDPSSQQMQKILKLGQIVPLGEDSEGRRVILIRAGLNDPNASEFNQEAVFKLNLMMLDVMLLEDDYLVVKGQVNVLDLKCMTLAHAIQMTPSLIKKTMTVFQDGYPIRPKAFHYLNMASSMETIFNLFKSFMKEKLKKRINIHSSVESLHTSVPEHILPKEYGGKAGPVQEIADRWAQKLMDWKDYFAEDAQYGADESKRPGRPKTHEDLFGLEGSFRPLNVD